MSTSVEGTCSIGYILPVSFFIMFHVFVLFSDFDIRSCGSRFRFHRSSPFTTSTNLSNTTFTKITENTLSRRTAASRHLCAQLCKVMSLVLCLKWRLLWSMLVWVDVLWSESTCKVRSFVLCLLCRVLWSMLVWVDVLWSEPTLRSIALVTPFFFSQQRNEKGGVGFQDTLRSWN